MPYLKTGVRFGFVPYGLYKGAVISELRDGVSDSADSDATHVIAIGEEWVGGDAAVFACEKSGEGFGDDQKEKRGEWAALGDAGLEGEWVTEVSVDGDGALGRVGVGVA